MNYSEAFHILRDTLSAWTDISHRDDLYEELNALDLSDDSALDQLITEDVLGNYLQKGNSERARAREAVDFAHTLGAAEQEELFEDLDIFFESVPCSRLLSRVKLVLAET